MASEKRLIDANALLKILDSSSESWARSLQAIRNWWPHAVGIKDNIVRVIKEMPTVDAVEVVRCKDCKHYGYEPYDNGDKCCERWGEWIFPNEDDFCSCGERKDNERKAD